jgi:subfamily B ATP-binding cassette protein MsbA
MNSDISEVLKKKPSNNWEDDVSILWQLSKTYIWRLIAALLCGLILSGINGAIAWAIKPALDSIFVEKSEGFLILLPFGIIVLFFLRGVFSYSTNYLMGSIGAKIVRSLRQGIYDKLLTLPISFYNRTSSGSVVSKVLNDVGMLNQIVAYTVKDFFVEGGTVIVLAAVAISRRWDLALLSFIVIPLIIYSIGRLGKRMKRTSMNTRKLISKVTTILHESLQGIKIIKAFTMEKEMAHRQEKALTEHYRNVMRETRINEFSSLIAEILGGIGVAIILFYGGHLVISEEISAGAFFSFIVAILMIYTPLKRLSRVHNNFQQARTVIERIREIVLVEPERHGRIEKEIEGQIVFDNVSFRYPSVQDYAIRDINLEIRRGELIALVGYSGAGKSTLADLVAGFWYPAEGDILIDGVNIKDLSLESLRKGLGVVTQDIVLFDDTIKANILFGRPSATDAEVIEAAKAAYAHEFIMELPEGYEAKIGERGARLSGGQKQRIAIARAILRNPSILILDEATSSLDVESEQNVQKALERLMAGRTTIVIAHSLSTVKKATRIVVMSGGRIIQQGRHEDLLLQSGLYQELYNMQFVSKESNTSSSVSA